MDTVIDFAVSAATGPGPYPPLSTAVGRPIETYVFTRDTTWVACESIQTDVFDHLLASIPEAGPRVLQRPSGLDRREWTRAVGNRAAN